MKALYAIIICCLQIAALSQPLDLPSLVTAVDLNNDGIVEFRYIFGQERIRESPEIWEGGFSIEPVGNNRFVRASASRIDFNPGETINGSRAILTNFISVFPLPPYKTYDISLLRFQALKAEGWRFTPGAPTGFDSRTNVIFGIRALLDDGVHYGWIQLTRSVNQIDVPFRVSDAKFHPVAGSEVRAGESPPLPEIFSSFTDTGIKFEWDSRWAGLTIESTTNLTSPISWILEASNITGQLSLDFTDEIKYFRFLSSDQSGP